MALDLTREKEFVNQYYYSARNLEWEAEHGAPETSVEVTFQLLNKDEVNQSTQFLAVLEFTIVREEFVIEGNVSQMNHLKGRVVNEPSEFTQEEASYIAAPLLEILRRLTFEVTEIALDKPGVNLEF